LVIEGEFEFEAEPAFTFPVENNLLEGAKVDEAPVKQEELIWHLTFQCLLKEKNTLEYATLPGTVRTTEDSHWFDLEIIERLEALKILER
jgi:hypothetical protein